ncbi:hypothetical protein ACCO45_004503 [Purpureocillium lilacinum]|uniref:Uncharacterized protein n=1 Tax=Purpureocillium lilacinum TaxID=33203 RepID=A0ACC4E2Y0_PURLI
MIAGEFKDEEKGKVDEGKGKVDEGKGEGGHYVAIGERSALAFGPLLGVIRPAIRGTMWAETLGLDQTLI